MKNNGLMVRDFEGHVIRQRSADSYFDATGMCKACGKLWADYYRTNRAQRFLQELSLVMGIPITNLVEVQQGRPDGGSSADQGTWVHPQVAMHLAQWCSPRLEVAVTGWMLDLFETGHASVNPDVLPFNREFAKQLMSSISEMVRAEVEATLSSYSQPQSLPSPFFGRVLSIREKIADSLGREKFMERYRRRAWKATTFTLRTIGHPDVSCGISDHSDLGIYESHISILNDAVASCIRQMREDLLQPLFNQIRSQKNGRQRKTG